MKKNIALVIAGFLLTTVLTASVLGIQLNNLNNNCCKQNLKLVKYSIDSNKIFINRNLECNNISNFRNMKNNNYNSDLYFNIGHSVQQTSDGGYIIIGETDADFDYLYTDVLLIKTDRNGNEIWNKTFLYGVGKSVQQTDDGGYIITGYYRADFGEGVYDLLLVKIDELCNIEWAFAYDYQGTEMGEYVKQTKDGGYIVTGRIVGLQISSMLLVKLNENGDVDWVETYRDSLGHLEAYSLDQTDDGGYIITGCKFISETVSSLAFLLKTDMNGETEWCKYFNGLGDTIAYSVITANNNYVITGWTRTIGNLEHSSMIIIRTDVIGEIIWEKYFKIKERNLGYSIDETIDGNYIIAGNTWSDIESCAFLTKFDEDGNEIFKKTYDGLGCSSFNCVQVTADKGFIITGNTRELSQRYYFVLLLKTDLNGNEEWFKIHDWRNNPPNKPTRPNGPTRVKINTEYMYSTVTTDPEGDLVWYLFDWGDRCDVNTIYGPYESGEVCERLYSWDIDTEWDVKVICVDLHSGLSEWSDPLSVTVPRNKLVDKYPLISKIIGRFPSITKLLKI